MAIRLILCLMFLGMWSQAGAAKMVRAPATIDEGFEGELPDFHTYQASYAADNARARTGSRSLRVTQAPDKTHGGAYFKLDGLLDFDSDYEFSAWVFFEQGTSVSVYISAQGEDGRRYTVNSVSGNESGKWLKLRGAVHAAEWRPASREFMLALSGNGVCWFDDVVLRKTVLPPQPLQAWPDLEANLKNAAGRRAVKLRRGAKTILTPRQGVLVPTLAGSNVVALAKTSARVPADGLITFAIDAPEALYLSGRVFLEPDEDLRPGLRAYLLCNDTVIGAPMVRAPSWYNDGTRRIDPAPDIQGERPDPEIETIEWRLEPGRHHLTVAGPHIRSGGVLRRIELEVSDKPAPAPLYTFGFFTDTHLGMGRPRWMNVKMTQPAIAELESSLGQLRREGAAFAIIGGDMTDNGRPEQIEALAGAIRRGGLPVYGSIGNHEAFGAGSRDELNRQIPDIFPDGSSWYELNKPPLRFLVLDGSWHHDKDGKVHPAYSREVSTKLLMLPAEREWLRERLAGDTQTPTVMIWHYPFYSRRGDTSCGYQLGTEMFWNEEVMEQLVAAPNVIATLNGHLHYTDATTYKGVVVMQNAAYVEWPNAYRVMRVYQDRVEWEVRQVHNRGMISEGVIPEKALIWMLSVREGDLAGSIPLKRAAR